MSDTLEREIARIPEKLYWIDINWQDNPDPDKVFQEWDVDSFEDGLYTLTASIKGKNLNEPQGVTVPVNAVDSSAGGGWYTSRDGAIDTLKRSIAEEIDGLNESIERYTSLWSQLTGQTHPSETICTLLAKDVTMLDEDNDPLLTEEQLTNICRTIRSKGLYGWDDCIQTMIDDEKTVRNTNERETIK